MTMCFGQNAFLCIGDKIEMTNSWGKFTGEVFDGLRFGGLDGILDSSIYAFIAPFLLGKPIIDSMLEEEYELSDKYPDFSVAGYIKITNSAISFKRFPECCSFKVTEITKENIDPGLGTRYLENCHGELIATGIIGSKEAQYLAVILVDQEFDARKHFKQFLPQF
jgi:hypothetical protein